VHCRSVLPQVLSAEALWQSCGGKDSVVEKQGKTEFTTETQSHRENRILQISNGASVEPRIQFERKSLVFSVSLCLCGESVFDFPRRSPSLPGAVVKIRTGCGFPQTRTVDIRKLRALNNFRQVFRSNVEFAPILQGEGVFSASRAAMPGKTSRGSPPQELR